MGEIEITLLITSIILEVLEKRWYRNVKGDGNLVSRESDNFQKVKSNWKDRYPMDTGVGEMTTFIKFK